MNFFSPDTLERSTSFLQFLCDIVRSYLAQSTAPLQCRYVEPVEEKQQVQMGVFFDREGLINLPTGKPEREQCRERAMICVAGRPQDDAFQQFIRWERPLFVEVISNGDLCCCLGRDKLSRHPVHASRAY